MGRRTTYIQTKQQISLIDSNGKINKNFSSSVNTMIENIEIIDNNDFKDELEDIINELNVLELDSEIIDAVSRKEIDENLVVYLKKSKVDEEIVNKLKEINKYKLHINKNYKYLVLIENMNNGKYILEMREDLTDLFINFKILYIKEIAQKNKENTHFILKSINSLKNFSAKVITQTKSLISSYDTNGKNDFFSYSKEECLNLLASTINSELNAKKLYTALVNKLNLLDIQIINEKEDTSKILKKIDQLTISNLNSKDKSGLKKLIESYNENEDDNTSREINTFFSNSKEFCVSKITNITKNRNLSYDIYSTLFDSLSPIKDETNLTKDENEKLQKKIEEHTGDDQINETIKGKSEQTQKMKKELDFDYILDHINSSFNDCEMLFEDLYQNELEEIELLHTYREESETEAEYDMYVDKLSEKESKLKEYKQKLFFPNSTNYFYLLYDVIEEYANIRIFGNGKYAKASTQIIKYYQHKIKNIKKYKGQYDPYIHSRNNRALLVKKIELYDQLIFDKFFIIEKLFNPLAAATNNPFIFTYDDEDPDNFSSYLENYLLKRYSKDSVEYKEQKDKVDKIVKLISILFPKPVVTDEDIKKLDKVGSLFG